MQERGGLRLRSSSSSHPKRRGSEVPLMDERPARESPKRRASGGVFGHASSSASEHPPAVNEASDAASRQAGGGASQDVGRANSEGGARVGRATSASPGSGRTGSGVGSSNAGSSVRGGSQRRSEATWSSPLRSAPASIADSSVRAGSGGGQRRSEVSWASPIRSVPARPAPSRGGWGGGGGEGGLALPVNLSRQPVQTTSLSSPMGLALLQSRDLRAPLAAARALGGRATNMIREEDEDLWCDFGDRECEVWVPCGVVLLLCLAVLI